MKLHSIICDDFLDDFWSIRAAADYCGFEDFKSPVDGVVYPGIKPIWSNSAWHAEVRRKLSLVFGRVVKINHLFMRLSLAGTAAPHGAHNDISMGTHSLMLYLNRAEDCRGGTSLLRHKDAGMECGPGSDAELAIWELDTNVHDAWDILLMCPMRPNRAFIFNSELMHRAEPINGFGDTPRNGRLVMTAFFSLE